MSAEGLPVYIIILFLLVLGGRYLLSPMNWNWLWRFLGRTVIGFIIMVIFNALAGLFGFILPLNPYTVVFCGFLGLPGLITLCYLKTWL